MEKQLTPAQRAYLESFDRLLASEHNVRLVRAEMDVRKAAVLAEAKAR